MTRLNHSKLNARDRMRLNGVDPIDDFGVASIPAAPKRRPSKEALRAEAADAVAKITRIIRCSCGHKASVAVPASWAGRRFRCSKCGEVSK